METAIWHGDEQLVARCHAGDQRAWRMLVERYAGLANGILRGTFRLSAADAEDAFQEVFTRLYVRLGTVRDERALAGWIAQVTRNVALDCLRRNGREMPAGEAIDEVGEDEPQLRALEAIVVREALMALPDHQQDILVRFFVRDQSYYTIGSELGIPPGTIASRISRALAALRQQVDGRSRVAVGSGA